MQIANNKQRKTLANIFAPHTPKDYPWEEVASLLRHIECDMKYNDPAVTIKKGSAIITMHMPHKGKNLSQDAIKHIKNFLKRIGVEP